MAGAPNSLRRRLYRALDPTARAKGLSTVNRILIAAILLGVVSGVLSTEPTLANWSGTFEVIEYALAAVFVIEFAARFWIAPENKTFGPGWRGRLHFMQTPAALFDLIAILATVMPWLGVNALPLRIIRVARLLRLAKLGRFSKAMRNLRVAVSSRRDELLLSLGLSFSVLVVGATLLYLIEGEVQPRVFGSVPRAMWWAMETLTTIGYGDVYPLTPLGKLVASLIAVAGIATVALPTGILAAAFSDAIQRERARGEAGDDASYDD